MIRQERSADTDSVAAVDLGSNSFHMVIGRVIGDQLSIVDRLRDPVRLAAGIDDEGRLSEETVERMLGSLERFGQRLRDIPPDRLRAIGTNTFRRARAPRNLLQLASRALGYPIEVLSGHEEARLIYLGVGHEQGKIDGRRLVVDIGGGSTEIVLGDDLRPIHLDSLYMGCVSFSRRFFPDGKLTRKAFKKAETAARLELETLERRYQELGWADCVGSSGTIKAVEQILRESGAPRRSATPVGRIDLVGIDHLRKAMVAAGSVEALALPGLSAERAPVLPGGLAILRAVFQALGIESMHWSKAALREGVLHDLLGRMRHEDPRDLTVRSLSERYSVDQEQARRVEATALRCLDQVAKSWSLGAEECRRLLTWAAELHEIGLALSYSGHHKHGAYILANSNMPGFSRDEKRRLALVVQEHRRRLTREVFAELQPPWRKRAFRLCVLLRLAVRLNRTRSTTPPPDLSLEVVTGGLRLRFPEGWLETHKLTAADLEDEAEVLRMADLRLDFGQPDVKIP